MVENDGPPQPRERGTPLVATAARWAACSLAIAGAFIVALAAALAFVHARRGLASFGGVFLGFAAVESALTFVLLRSEESRLTRELRTARTGTTTVRGMAARHRSQVPFFARPFSCTMAQAAVLLADGDRDGASDALRRGSPLMRGGRLDRLRAIVRADLQRATRSPDALDVAIADLRRMPPLHHREADRYRTHVLVKAVLERGDDETALDLARDLRRSADDEQALYAVWLRVWFDLDEVGESDEGADRWPPLVEAEARLAALAARAHGAERLVDKLEARLLAIAHPVQQG
jgi:hypothetical protein